MEQGLSFIVVITLCSLAMILSDSPLIFLTSFIGGSTYLLIRSKRKGWNWKI
jgi:hypothetical protein